MSGYWSSLNPSTGPVWELLDGRQVQLDYRSCSLLGQLVSGGSGELLLRQFGAGDRGRFLVAEYDGERVFLGYYEARLSGDLDVLDFPSPNGDETVLERHSKLWERVVGTETYWQWSPSELLSHLDFD